MVKSYLKYEHSKSFGIVASNTSNLVWNAQGRAGAGQAVVAANEEVLCWDIKKGELVSRWRDDRNTVPVTAIAQSKVDKDVFAVGYEDGSIRLWDSKIATVIVNFNGHKSAITTLAFDKSGVRLASGSKDTDVIIWDLVAEVGQFKLRGHKDQITGLQFVEPEAQVEDEDNTQAMVLDSDPSAEGYLLTTGKDSLIKLWDLSSRHCIETHIAQTNGECWALGLSPDYSGCITAGNDGELKVWFLDTAGLASLKGQVDAPQSAKFLHERGTLFRQHKDKAIEIVFHPRRDYFAVHGTEKAVEVWRIRSEAEVKKSLARKKKRRREKAAKEGKTEEDAENDDQADDLSSAEASDFFVQYVIVRTGGKVRSVDWAVTSGSKEINLLAGTTNNQLEYYSIPTKDASKSKKDELPDYTRSLAVDLPGHRTDIRAVSLSSDDKMLATAANGGLKIWNIKTQTCIRTFECGYALCCAFLPGDKVVVVGTKTGELELFDVASASLLDSVTAHEGAIWSLQVHPDGKSVVSGSADKSAKFWDFRIIQEEVLGTTRTVPKLKLVQSRTLKVADDILCVRYSPDGKYIAVSLLDNTVKVFFTDSLKLYLNLYGHKLPVLSMDISYDSKLIVTSSADKNIRIWGLDFGDCHKALFGHQDSILQVAFVPHNSDGNGHHFFSSSKDRCIKYWDGDKFEQIQRLDGHHGEVWAMAVGHSGQFLVTAGHDKSIRVWDETDEQIFLEEEREKEIEELYEKTLTTSLERDPDAEDQDGEVGAATKQTVETLMAGERIAEALEIGIADLNLLKEYEDAKKTNPHAPPPQRNPIFIALGNITAEAYVMSVLNRIKASALHDALLVLPFSTVPMLFTFLNVFSQRSMNIPLTCRILFFMLKTHHRQIVASRTMRTMLDGIRANLRAALKRQKDEMGFNIAALKVVGMQIQEKSVKDYVDENWDDGDESRSIKKRAFVQVS
ncbi:U3 small nucleolar RNA-associated protein 12 [Colletotrichum fructicola]|uniref:U3 small nucleolar RNA-associated protein 12 n=1 Tax=Colletotrichum fructicola (strain Nara gc5) TaxID=1213859 RepID=L2G3C7_COLFN|nr:U3 small nucleolar RNA-associated protein 12 [Colletotrichum fructicola]KAE9579055.1 U3 small nucleolar RNA-associated protein 12 [Colletotrichum fructicola]KAF4423219.1 U3 small nucleolar RNA-associated protein 12 [Colletotrichum fructicola]KAF4491004.1 U3 small nucleolar RNA-associated protein 12 [Colletotrichum fructicola Nara gc5]KAI8283146.1 U3 small nucleolar RNA-associated protein 12 [Colletotrichum sp. SAR11_57]